MNTQDLYTNYISYFRNIAEQHTEIAHSGQEKHFSRLDFEEYVTEQVTLNHFPHLVLESLEISTKGNNSDHSFLEPTGAIVVVDKFTRRHDDHDDQEDIENKALNILMDILARIEEDMQTLCHPLISYININDVDIQKLAYDTFDSATGWRCTFTFSNRVAWELDASKWSDK